MVPLEGYAMPVLASRGSEQRAHVIAGHVDRALGWLQTGLPRRPVFTLVVADATDWDAVAAIPIYGMPESVPGRIVTSPQPAQWWQDYWDSLRPHLPAPALDKVTQAYGRPPDFTIMADLVAVHELTHLFHDIHPVTWASEFPEIWVMELFANLGMYGYVATHHPEHLPLLHSLTGATLAAGTAPWPFTALDAMGDSMRGRVEHYVWYQYRLIGMAASIWDARGIDALTGYQTSLGDPALAADEIVARLAAIDPTTADSVRRWPA